MLPAEHFKWKKDALQKWRYQTDQALNGLTEFDRQKTPVLSAIEQSQK